MGLFILTTLLILGVSAYTRLSIFITSFIILLSGVIYWLTDIIPPWLLVLTIVLLLPFNLHSLRRLLFSKPALRVFKKIMPQMSETEAEAINAGTTWWEAELFSGQPSFQILHEYPRARLTVDEQAFLDGPVEVVCQMANDFEINHTLADMPEEMWQYLKANKFFAMIIKKEYGGLEFSAYAQSKVLQKLSGASAVLASTVGVPNSLGPGELLQHYGTDEQKQHYLPRLVNGDEIPCFALTSPEAGSDAGAIPDEGVVCVGTFEGKEVLGMRLNWNKRYITLAPIATVLGLAFKLSDPDKLLGGNVDVGITCALIPTNLDGISIGRRHFPLNTMFHNGPTQGKDVFVPIDYIIGGADMAGKGWSMLMECLSVGRGITLPSTSAGGVKTLALASGAYARIRRQFKLPIGKMEGIEEPLARLGANAYLMDAVTKLTTTGIDLGEKPSVISAIVKYHLTTRMQNCVVDAMDIHGGKGICLGPDNYLGRGYQGAPIAITVEGANILTRNMIIYGQGAIRAHPFVLAELKAANLEDRREALHQFDNAMFGHIGFAISNSVRSFVMGLTHAKFVGAPGPKVTRRYYQKVTQLSSNLALISDIAMASLGGSLKRRERLSARMGDILSNLYLATAVLKRFHEQGCLKEEEVFVHWNMQQLIYDSELAIQGIIHNFPSKAAAWVIKLLTQPLGVHSAMPSDKLDHSIARLLQTPGEMRSRLAKDMYLTEVEHNPVGMQEQALKLILEAEPIYDKVVAGVSEQLQFRFLDQVAKIGLEKGLISEDEAALLNRAEVARLRSINVADFDSDELKAGQAIALNQEDVA